MSFANFTPKEMAAKAHFGQCTEEVTFNFLTKASPRDLQEFIHNVPINEHSHWFHRAKVALDIRLAEDAAKTADKLIQHTEKLTNQTDTHIQHSKKLTEQTEKLLNESVSLTALTRQLKFWTVILGVFAAIQIVIMAFDYLKHK